jgi:oligopeptide transport system substrate-binding protein
MTGWTRHAAALIGLAALLSGCAKTPPPQGTAARQVLRVGNGDEPQDLDPHVVTGIPEYKIIQSLTEGLISPDPKDQHPVPGVASSWEISDDRLVYTFHLRPDARWSDGSPVTSEDFLVSWKRILSPKIGAEFAYLVYNYVKGAKDYYDGKTSDFSTVGFRAPDPRTIIVTLKNPTPYLLRIISNHQSWYPVPVKTLARFGALTERNTAWTRPGNFVGNGPFVLSEWIPHQKLVVTRSPTYWDRANVHLDEIDFMPVPDEGTEERMFRTGQLDCTETIPISKIATYEREHPEMLRLDPFVAVYYYRFNVAFGPFKDKRVRKALSLAVDRERIVRDVTRGHQRPAYALSYPDVGGYTSRAQLSGSLDDARRLLAEAGYPGGRGLPLIHLLYNTSEGHKQIAEAVQEMWRRNLGVESELVNEEWKVYLAAMHATQFEVCRSGWVATFPDPSVFLDIMTSDNGNNCTNYSNPEYDRLEAASLLARNDTDRYEIYQKMDAILVDDCPVIPIYYYTRGYLLSPKVRGYWPNILDTHPYKYIYLQD